MAYTRESSRSERGDALIARFIKPNPHRPGIADAWLAEWGVPVWAVVGHYLANDRNVARVAADYDISVDAVEAALRYYRKYESVIDARIAANAAPMV